jgi:S-formylglutathione hydrolase FrmB
MKEGESNEIAAYPYYHHVFGAPDKLIGSHNDPKALAKKLADGHEKIPNVYMACGTEDFLISQNRDFHKYLEKLGIQHTYVEGPGIHNWPFWNTYIENALVWLGSLSGK